MKPVNEPDNHDKGKKGLSRVRAKVGRNPLPAPTPKACPGGVIPAEIWTSEGRLTRPWKVVISPVAAEPGVSLGLARALPGHLEARWARVFVSLVLSDPQRGSLFDLEYLGFPRALFPLGHSLRYARQPPQTSWVPQLTPPLAPAPYPLRDRGQRQPASRGRRAAPNRPGEPRENRGGSREIQPREQRGVPPRPPPRGARRHACRQPRPTGADPRRHPRSITRSSPAPTAAIRGGRRRRRRGEGETGRGPLGARDRPSVLRGPARGEAARTNLQSSVRPPALRRGRRGGCPGAGTGGWAPGCGGGWGESQRLSGRQRRRRRWRWRWRAAGVGEAGGGRQGVNPDRGQSLEAHAGRGPRRPVALLKRPVPRQRPSRGR